jgi:hypothetical protein
MDIILRTEWVSFNEASKYNCYSDSVSQIIKTKAVNFFSRFISVRLIDDYVLVINWERGIEAIDVRNPSKPVRIGSYYDGGRPNGFQVVGDLIYLADGSDGLEIIRFRKEGASFSQ